ncbi:AMED_5909 family protein [Actinophytocola glycyrrhizae]|uniref:AMED_5909 family protein n=1 Tax=Actinophytocola glycyrrhizae TaxID=2044873 RepID=A0ABV9RZ79_9PSEU
MSRKPPRVLPSSLFEAREVLSQQRPSRDAGPAEWIRFHRHSADVYAHTAKVDERHRHEATQYVGIEIRRAREIEHRLDPTLDDES